MGASFNTLSLPGSLDKSKVKEAFEDAQAQDRYENGHSYSGGFGMCSGLKFHNGNGSLPHDAISAETLLQSSCVKWEEAIAIRHKTLDGGEAWMIGAWCAS